MAQQHPATLTNDAQSQRGATIKQMVERKSSSWSIR